VRDPRSLEVLSRDFFLQVIVQINVEP
jgi:hypothetical protein